MPKTEIATIQASRFIAGRVYQSTGPIYDLTGAEFELAHDGMETASVQASRSIAGRVYQGPIYGLAAGEFDLQKADVHERMTYHRAIDAAVWAMPLMNFKFYRDALADAGVGPGDIGYFSKLQDWRFQTATPNNTTPYILTYWNFKDGPIVVEMPPSAEGIGIFGTIMDSWQRSLDDVGAKGRDGGRGAK
ncbi:MAG: DUF1254 domain-containing protein, partial [Planctomycetota bacterium]